MFASRKSNTAIETRAISLTRKLVLEPRFVFDAAMAAEFLDAATHLDMDTTAQHAGESTGDNIALALAQIDESAALPLGVTAEEQALIAAHNSASSNTEIAFIDSRLDGLDQLVAAVPAGTRIVLIDGARDGVVQMVEALRGETGISGIHLISHGTEGHLNLGSAAMTADTMNSVYRSALASISSNLTAEADILIYGCNFAAGEQGMAAARILAEITGADVAASEDLTGGAAGADWLLERQTGDIETATLAPDAWDDVLVTINIQDGNGAAIKNLPYSGTLVGLATAIDPPTGVNYTAGTFATAHGSVTILANGTFTYTPANGYLGSDAFAFEATATDPNDGIQTSATAIFQIQVNPDPNFIITANGETNAVGHQNPANTLQFSGTVVDNVTPSVSGGAITTYTLVSNTANGTLTFNTDGTYSYHPNPGFSGQDSFTFSANDASPESDAASATVVFNVAPPPLDAYGYTTFVSHNTSVTVTPGQYEADPLATFTYTAGPIAGGTLVSNGDGSFTFTPNAGFSGTVSVPYTVTDSNGYTSTDYITFIVDVAGGTGLAPIVAYPDTYTLQQGTTSYNGVAYSANPTNSVAPIYSVVVTSPPTHGTLSAFDAATGSYRYDATPGYIGQDVFTFTVTDQYGQTATSTETINIVEPYFETTSRVVFAPIGSAVSGNLSGQTQEWVSHTTEKYYINGQQLVTGATIPTAHGVLTITDGATGAYSWQPNAGFSGPEVITWTSRNYWGAGATEFYETEQSSDTIISPNRIYAGHRGFAVEQGSTLTGTVTPYSGSPTGWPSYSMPWGATNGTAMLDSSGNYSYTPNAGFTGIDRFGYTVANGLGNTATNYITVLVTGPRVIGNLDPVAIAIPDRINIDTDPVAGVNISSFFSDPDGDPLTFVADGLPSGLVMSSSGVITGTIDGHASTGGFGGQYEVSVFALDGRGGVAQQTFLWTVSNPAPDAVDQGTSTPFNTPVVVNLLANDSDADGDTISVSAASLANPADGSLSNVGGVWTFTPAGGFTGTAVVNYTITDQDGATDTAQHTIVVGAANLPPSLVDPDPTVGTPYVNPLDPSNLIVPVVDNVPAAVDLDTYFVDPDGDPLTFTPDLSGLPPWLTYDPTSHVFSGTPPVDNVGPFTIPVTVSDGSGGTFIGSVTIVPGNPLPDAVNDATTTPFNTPVVVALLANDTDPDGDPLSVSVATLANPADGTLTNVGGVWTFTPAAGFTGTAVVNYTITDQDGATDSAQHNIVVGANQPPALVDPDPTVGTPYVNPLDPSNLIVPVVDNVPTSLDLDNYFTDPNGDPLSFTPDLTGLPAWLSYDPVTRVFSGTPPVDNVGPISIPVTVSDGNGGTFVCTITIVPSNPGPDAVYDGTSTPFNTPVVVTLLANDTDPDGDPLSVTVATLANPADGTLTSVGGVWTFTPAAGFTGTAVVNYTITDQDGATDSAQHNIVVAVPAQPVAVNDYYTTPYQTPVAGDVRGGDTYAPGSTFTQLSPPMNGAVVFNPNGTYTYTPAPGFVGTETFAYEVRDPLGGTSVAYEVIRVSPPPIVAVNDAYTTPYNTAVNGNASANDTFAAGSTFVAITAPAHGTIAFNSDGTYIYTPNAGYAGVDMFAYAVTDPLGQTRFATDTITITPPAAPIAVNDSYTTGYQTPLAGNAAAADTYQPGAVFAAVSQPTHGSLTFNPDGTYTYVPAAGYAGTDTFTYSVRDASGVTVTATETITITPPALLAVNDSYSGVYGVPVIGNAAGGDTFAPGSVFAVATPPTNGSVVMNANGTFTYTPAPGFAGTVVFTYTVTDPTGQVVTAIETIVITPPALIAVDDSYTTAFNTPVSGNAAAGDSYAQGSVFAVATLPAQGTVTMNANGSYVYTPPLNFAGTVTFTYQITDPSGQVRTATETIIVSPPMLTAVNDAYATPFNTPLNGNAAAGDSYAAGSVFTATSTPAHGTVVMNANGTYRYIPALNFVGTDTFTYMITDPTGRTVTATETITVAARPTLYRCLTTFSSHRRR